MRRLLPLLLALGLATAALLRAQDTAAEEPLPAEADPLAGAPAPLAAAIRKFGQDAERWACTQHEIHYDRAGKIESERLIRYDPSLPYDRQWTLLKKNGQAATPQQVEAYRRAKEQREKNRLTLGELLDAPGSRLRQETAETLTYEVPLRKMNNNRLPPEKFQILVRVARATQVLQTIEARLRTPLRVALVGKVKKAGAVLTFAPVDPRFAPPLAAIKADGSGSFLFIPVSAAYEFTRTDFRRVKPYSDRFVVRPGPIRYLDF